VATQWLPVLQKRFLTSVVMVFLLWGARRYRVWCPILIEIVLTVSANLRITAASSYSDDNTSRKPLTQSAHESGMFAAG